jgi:hypothetical protein
MDRRTTVLVLDFDQDLLITLERVLEDSGFSTTTTWDVREGRTLMQCGCYDFFVIGNRPPELDAEVLLGDLRGQGLRFGSFVLGNPDYRNEYGNLVDRIRRFPCQAQSPRQPSHGETLPEPKRACGGH